MNLNRSKLRVGVLSDTRLPTLPNGGHGLGRVAWDIADGLAKKELSVTLYGGVGSVAPDGVALITHEDELVRAREQIDLSAADVWIDLSHRHDLSRFWPDAKVLNYMMDLECDYTPPRCLVANWWQQKAYPKAQIVPIGVNGDESLFVRKDIGRWGLVFCGKLHPRKGWDVALNAADMADRHITLYGENPYPKPPPHWGGEIKDQASLYTVLGEADALLAPSREDAGGRVILEAAMCGTPTITTDWSGAQAHVLEGVSGFVCATVDEMAEAIGMIEMLDRRRVREWALKHHSIAVMLSGLRLAIATVMDGGKW